MQLTRNLLLCAALLLATTALAPAADNTRGAVEQSGGNIVPQNPSLPQLRLSDAQREQIRQTLLSKDTEV
jgi:Spy/CpxP family protein refolding chaperone